jgi:hypothetical protein
MYAKLTTTKADFGDWFCTALHRRWWKAVWIAREPRIELKCELCGRHH